MCFVLILAYSFIAEGFLRNERITFMFRINNKSIEQSVEVVISTTYKISMNYLVSMSNSKKKMFYH